MVKELNGQTVPLLIFQYNITYLFAQSAGAVEYPDYTSAEG